MTVIHLNDRLSSLPDEILLKIWSHLTTKEAARANLVSRMSYPLWLLHPLLNFEDKNAILQKRSTFIDRVNYILKHHQGPVVDEFRIAFDLNHEYRSHIDNWLVFAFSKQVKRLELVLKRVGSWPYLETYKLKMPVEYRMSSSFGTALTSLCLVSVHLTTQVIESFLESFPSLEILCIRFIYSFTSISACSSLALKHLELTNCERLDLIDLVVPHLVSFTCDEQPTALHFRNASSLSVVSIGSFMHDNRIAYALDCLLLYCAQLEHLELRSNLYEGNLQINQCPAFPNLKHLELNIAIPANTVRTDTIYGWNTKIETNVNLSLLGWTPVIKACPVLQKLTLNLEAALPLKYRKPMRKFIKLDAHPLSSLKTLEIVGFLGHGASLELVMFVMDNADMLEEMIVEALSPCMRKGTVYPFQVTRIPDLESHKLALQLLETRPRVKLIFRDEPSY